MKDSNKLFKPLGALFIGLALSVVYDRILRPLILGWGSSKQEITKPWPGDELIPKPLTITTRGIHINAPLEQVWPWLVQIGQGRGGFYSFDWLENLLGMDIHNVEHIVPEFQQLSVGDLVPFWQGVGVTVQKIDPPFHLVLGGTFDPNSNEIGGTWSFFLQPTQVGTTRLIVRTRIAQFPPQWLSRIFSFILLEPAHFVMERRMLMGLKSRAERNRVR